ncbi:MAG TPA: metal ABC transporter permease [Candidatus Paceibacterota bacterium]|nr:metal ABC transporter permease [Candidatus Paceibacterota bacterium]
MTNELNLLSLATGIFVGGAAGYIGSFMVLRRMSLVGDALSHVALPGLAIALLFNINPFIGAFSFLFVATLSIWVMEQKTTLPIDTIFGVFFTASLAIGILITPEAELLEALFGDITKITPIEAAVAIILSIVIIAATRAISKNELLGIISNDLAISEGVNISKTNLAYLMLVALIVALGIKAVGTILTGALVIIPAASAKNIASNFRDYSFYSLLFGSLSAVIGIIVVQQTGLSSGPVVILSSVAIFILSLIFKKE